MTTTLADLLAGVDMEGGENFCDSVYNFLKNQGKDINLITNSGFGVWSQSDANKGLGYLDFDVGSVIAPVVGELITSASGAVGKVIWLDITGGTFAGNNAVGTIYLGACSTLCFNNNEAITWPGGGNATVNQPDGAVGADGIIKNGAFVATAADWTPGDCTLASIAGGQVGNCLEMTRTGGAVQTALQAYIAVIGKIYKLSFYVKSGTSGNEAFQVYEAGGQVLISGTTTAAWVLHTATYEATTVNPTLILQKNSATAGTMLFDEVTVYEITPCCTVADALAFDGWVKPATLDIYRQHNDGGTLTKDGSFYALRCVPSAVDNYVAIYSGNEETYQKYAGRTVTFGCWAKTSTASHFKLRVEDGGFLTDSNFHTGGGAWEWIEITNIIRVTASAFGAYLWLDAAPTVDGATIVYVSQPMLVFGSSLGEDMYQPRLQEMIWLEKNIPSNVYDGLLNQSDLAYTDLNIEADSDAMLPKGAKVIAVLTDIEDAGSGAGLDVHLELRKDAIADTFFINSVAGKPNDIHNHVSGLQPCDVNGDVDIHIDASAANTLDINEFEYHGVQVN